MMLHKCSICAAEWLGAKYATGCPGHAPAPVTVDFAPVAKALVIAALGYIDYFQACPFCKAGEDEDDGCDKEHEEECPLVGFDHTRDCEALRAWAKTT